MVGWGWTFWDGGLVVGVVVGLGCGGVRPSRVGGREEDAGPGPAGAAQVGELAGGCAGWGDVGEYGSHQGLVLGGLGRGRGRLPKDRASRDKGDLRAVLRYG